MTSDELKKAVSTVLEQPHHTQLYLVLKINNELVLRLADVEDEKTAPEIQRLFEEFLTAAIVDNDDMIVRNLSIADESSNAIYQMAKLEKSQWDEYLEWLEDYEYDKFAIPRPEIIVILDMPVEVSQKLLSARYGGDEAKKDIHESNVAFLKACRETALYTADKKGWYILPCSDGENPYTPEKINKELSALIYG